MSPEERDEFIVSLREMAKAAERCAARDRSRARNYTSWAQWLAEHPEADPAEVSLEFDPKGNVVDVIQTKPMGFPR